MQQEAIFSDPNYPLLEDSIEEMSLQNEFDRLSQKKKSWEYFNSKIEDLFSASRLISSKGGRTLLHLAVLDNQVDVIRILASDPILRLRRDAFGLSPLDMAQCLDRKEALLLLQPPPEGPVIPELPPFEQFEYLPYPTFETREGFEQVLGYIAKAKEEDKIPPEKIWMGIYFDKEISKGMHPPISIRHINSEIGYGVFADKKIPPCTYVGEYSGMIQQRSPRYLKEKKHCLRYTVWETKKNFTVDAEKKGNFTRFINHSSKPNLGLQSVYWRGMSRMIFVALKEIREGAQLTFDYGALFWKNNSQKPKEWTDDF